MSAAVRTSARTRRNKYLLTKDALTARRIDGGLANLTNVADSHKETFAGFQFTANVLDGGSAKVDGSIDPLAIKPTFDMNLSVKNVQLPQVNPWLTRFIKADAESGEFELYTELAAADENPLKRLWEGLIDIAANIVENREEDQVAARIPFSGTIEKPDADLLATIGSVMHNAFVSAFARSLEGSISVRSVRQSLKDNGDEKRDKRKDEKEDKERPHGPRATG